MTNYEITLSDGTTVSGPTVDEAVEMAHKYENGPEDTHTIAEAYQPWMPTPPVHPMEPIGSPEFDGVGLKDECTVCGEPIVAGHHRCHSIQTEAIDDLIRFELEVEE